MWSKNKSKNNNKMLRQNYPDTVFTLSETTGVSGSQIFTLGLYDFNTLLAKFYVPTFVAGSSPTLDVYLQTQDPSSGTFRDLVHFAQVTGTVTETLAYFASIGKPTGYTGSVPTGALAAGTSSTLPLMSRGMRVVYTYGGTNIVGSPTATLTLSAIDQSSSGN
jgi:hypothetical protein